jgi:hypothetical protein
MGGLFDSTVLDVAVGLMFVYLLLALLCTTVNEWIAGLLGTRSKLLEKGIGQLLDSQSLTDKTAKNQFLDEFYKHPLITGMMQGKTPPSYLSARAFAAAVMDIVTPKNPGSITFADLEDGIKDLPDGDVKTALLALVQNAHGQLQAAQSAIEAWFNDTMERVSGWFKRTTQIRIVVLAFGITILANADTVRIARSLWTDPVARSAIVEGAKAETASPSNNPQTPNVTSADVGKAIAQDRSLLGELIGWQGVDAAKTTQDWFERILGWILTAIALSLGGPFWFDLLNKFINIRSAGRSPDEAPKTS